MPYQVDCGFMGCMFKRPWLKELGRHISDHNAINSTAILFLPYKEAISLVYCQFTGLFFFLTLYN